MPELIDEIMTQRDNLEEALRLIMKGRGYTDRNIEAIIGIVIKGNLNLVREIANKGQSMIDLPLKILEELKQIDIILNRG